MAWVSLDPAMPSWNPRRKFLNGCIIQLKKPGFSPCGGSYEAPRWRTVRSATSSSSSRERFRFFCGVVFSVPTTVSSVEATDGGGW